MDLPNFQYFSPFISPEDNKMLYKQLAKIHHPDKNNGSKKSEIKFKEINEEYQEIQQFQKTYGVLKQVKIVRNVNIDERRQRRNNRNPSRSSNQGTHEFFDLTPQDIEALGKIGHNIRVFFKHFFD